MSTSHNNITVSCAASPARAVKTTALFMWLAACACFTAGCGGKDFDRIPVAGTVSLNGAPLEDGVITFVPTANPGPKARASIVDGEYQFDSATGPSPGKMRVEITAVEAEAEELERDIRNGENPALHSVEIPEKYNASSTLEVEITRSGPHEFPFQLENRSHVK
jgi:hypothetical protein